MFVVQVLGSLWMIFFHGVESQTRDDIMAERRKHSDEDEAEEVDRFAYNFTMREKDFWTCSHGIWGSHVECRCAHPLPEERPECDDAITDMCIHRPSWACDPRRCTWDITSHPDGIGFCRIKASMLEDEFNKTRLYPELDDQMICTRHKCSVVSMIQRCYHYLHPDQLLMFKKKCRTAKDQIAAMGISCEIDC